jgi:hypothetical protein
MKTLRTLIWVSVGVAGLGLAGCYLGAGGPGVYVGPQEPSYITIQEAPPPVVVEQRPPQPSGLYVWIDGYWNWNGRYVWERGHWAHPPHDHAVWVAPRYERHEQGYRYAPGHWKVEKQEEKRENARGQGADEHRGQPPVPSGRPVPN